MYHIVTTQYLIVGVCTPNYQLDRQTVEFTLQFFLLMLKGKFVPRLRGLKFGITFAIEWRAKTLWKVEDTRRIIVYMSRPVPSGHEIDGYYLSKGTPSFH